LLSKILKSADGTQSPVTQLSSDPGKLEETAVQAADAMRGRARLKKRSATAMNGMRYFFIVNGYSKYGV
jgi:hypothetical protein